MGLLALDAGIELELDALRSFASRFSQSISIFPWPRDRHASSVLRSST